MTRGTLRCPALLVHQRWAGQSAYLDGGTRWPAISSWKCVTILSVHLPLSRCKISDYQDTLTEIKMFLQKRPEGAVLLGNDCNVSLAGVREQDLIGEAVAKKFGSTLSAQEKERQGQGTAGRIHGRAWFDGMQHVAKIQSIRS